MTDIYDALLSSDGDAPVSNADIVARLRQQAALGQLGALSGIAGLQKLGGSLSSDATNQADMLYKTREATKERALALAQAAELANEREKDRLALGANASQDRALQRALSEQELQQRLTAGTVEATNKANDKADAADEKATSGANALTDAYQQLIDKATSIRNSPDLPRVSGVRGEFWNIPGTGARDLYTQLQSLGSQQALQGIQSLRAQGGTLGRVTNTEFNALKDALSPVAAEGISTEARQRNLDLAINIAKQHIKRIQDDLAALQAGKAARAARPTGSVTVKQGFMGGSALPRSTGGSSSASGGSLPPLDSYYTGE